MGNNAEVEKPVYRADAEIVRYPKDVPIEDFYRTPPFRILVSVAHCMKGLSCPHPDGNGCDVSCIKCELSRLKIACLARLITFRIETSNDDLMSFMDKDAVRFKWVIGVACRFEIKRLSPFLWEKYGLRQILFTPSEATCALNQEGEQYAARKHGNNGATGIGRIVDVLNRL